MPVIQIPNNWQPRSYQRRLWSYLETGGTRAIEIAHRRWGKDDVCLHWACVAAHKRVATYWHMLPQANQARKAIWEAVNPHTGKRRIDEAFPLALRASTREQDMLIKFRVGSTWQVLGSDNFDSLVGSPPAGVVFSEFALANPAAWAYIRPILRENGGWALFITTPRGKNHAHALYDMALQSHDWYCERQTADDTAVFSTDVLETERNELIALYGEDAGDAYFRQEYYCSFDAAILGAYYGQQLERLENDGRVCEVEYDPEIPVHTAWDLGYSDDTSIWWYQVIRGEIHVIDCYSSHGHDVDHYAQIIKSRPYKYGHHNLPHDARAKTLASGGKSIQEQFAAHFGWAAVHIVPQLSLEDGIQAVRKMLPSTWIDKDKCKDGLEALKQYRREWDQDKRCFTDKPLHDWTSHYADAFRMLAVAWQHERQKKQDDQPPRFPQQQTFNELIQSIGRKRRDE